MNPHNLILNHSIHMTVYLNAKMCNTQTVERSSRSQFNLVLKIFPCTFICEMFSYVPWCHLTYTDQDS